MKIISMMIFLALIQVITIASAQEFPKKKPIKIVVGAAVGGGADTLTRIIADSLQRKIGQTVIVENKAGASGAIGAQYVAKSPADGYTLLFLGSEFSALPAVRRNLPYKIEDFTFLVRCFTSQPMLLARPGLPVNSVNELIARMKTHPSKITYGSTGVGGVIHLATSMFEGAAGVRALHVPDTGSVLTYSAMMGGHVDFTEGIVPFLDGLKVLASTGTRRHPAYPDVPTLEESLE